MKKPALGGFF